MRTHRQIAMAEKLFYSMGEVAEMFDVNPSLLRHWQTQFSILRPKRNKKGNRLYTPGDVENLKLIYHLVKERGMTLEGARKALREARSRRQVPRDAELMERLQRVRALLLEVRAELDGTEHGAIPVDTPDVPCAGETTAATAACEAETTPAVRKKANRRAVVKIEEEGAGAETQEEAALKQARPETAGSGQSGTARAAARRPRRKKEEDENQELFAFYEQSLF